MNRRQFTIGIAATAGMMFLPKGASAKVTKEEWQEWAMFSQYETPHVSHAWFHMAQHDTEESATQVFNKLVNMEPNSITPMEFAGTEFLVISDEVRERNEVGDESACFDTDYENFELFVLFAREGNMVIQSAFRVETDKGMTQALEMIQVIFEHKRMPTELVLLDITGNGWTLYDSLPYKG